MYLFSHYLARIFMPLIFMIAVIIMGMDLPNSTIATYFWLPVIPLFITYGIIFNLAVAGRLRCRCLHCRGKNTEFGFAQFEGVWIACKSCSKITEEYGLFKLRLRTRPMERRPRPANTQNPPLRAPY